MENIFDIVNIGQGFLFAVCIHADERDFPTTHRKSILFLALDCTLVREDLFSRIKRLWVNKAVMHCHQKKTTCSQKTMQENKNCGPRTGTEGELAVAYLDFFGDVSLFMEEEVGSKEGFASWVWLGRERKEGKKRREG